MWALGIYTGNSESGIDYTSMYSLFSTQVVLTKEGLDHVDEVSVYVSVNFEMLQNIQNRFKKYHVSLRNDEDVF